MFEGTTFPIGSRDRVCVVGRNGKGKSTLLKVLAGRLQPLAGDVAYHPVLRTGYYGQTYANELNPERTVVEEIQASSPDCTAEKARDICGNLMFPGDLALKKIAVLSGGEKSRVVLGRLLMQPSNLLLLDEPTNHLDMESSDALLAALDGYEGSVVLVTHNEMFLHALANRLVVFDRGRATVFEGTYRDFLERIGWESDESEPGAPPAEGEICAPSPGRERQDAKKARALLLQERSRVLKPLEAELRRLEAAIMAMEAEQVSLHEELVRASTAGDAPAIARLARRNAQIPPELNALYDTLDPIIREFEARTEEFRRRMEALEAG